MLATPSSARRGDTLKQVIGNLKRLAPADRIKAKAIILAIMASYYTKLAAIANVK